MSARRTGGRSCFKAARAPSCILSMCQTRYRDSGGCRRHCFVGLSRSTRELRAGTPLCLTLKLICDSSLVSVSATKSAGLTLLRCCLLQSPSSATTGRHTHPLVIPCRVELRHFTSHARRRTRHLSAASTRITRIFLRKRSQGVGAEEVGAEGGFSDAEIDDVDSCPRDSSARVYTGSRSESLPSHEWDLKTDREGDNRNICC